MVKYYGRARTRIGSVNTNQLGLKMSGCPSKVGLNPVNNRYIQHRVNCMNGICGIPLQNGAPWRISPFRNLNTKYCKPVSNKCLAAAGGIGTIYTPYFKTNAPGTKGCGYYGLSGSAARGARDSALGNPPCTTTNFKTTKVQATALYNACGNGFLEPVFGELAGVNTNAPALTATFPEIKGIVLGNPNLCPTGTVIIYVTGPLSQGTPIAANFINTFTGQIHVYSVMGGPSGGPPAYFKLEPISSANKLQLEQAYCVQLIF